MKIPLIFVSLLWFCLYLAVRFRVNRQKEQKKEQSFWDRENEANFARVKPLDDLTYITVDTDALPFARIPKDDAARDALERVRALAGEKIVNLTGISNTDLKLRYGAANLETLTAYDQNFTTLATSLQKWAHGLIEEAACAEEETKAALLSDARTLLEFSVASGSDITATYKDLAALYEETLSKQDAYDAVLKLKEGASTLSSMTKPQLLSFLEERAAALS